MGNLLFAEDRHGEALGAFETAVRLYDDSTNRFSLGQAYLKLERYNEAAFQYYRNAKTPVSAMDSYLENAGASKLFTMQFQFNKEMDRESVENILNWSITRSSESGPAMAYNMNMGIPSTEIGLQQYPTSVYYDENTWTATIRFNVTQNEDADGTIDPEHIVFAFSGMDADGNEMDEDFDQYMAFCGSF